MSTGVNGVSTANGIQTYGTTSTNASRSLATDTGVVLAQSRQVHNTQRELNRTAQEITALTDEQSVLNEVEFGRANEVYVTGSDLPAGFPDDLVDDRYTILYKDGEPVNAHDEQVAQVLRDAGWDGRTPSTVEVDGTRIHLDDKGQLVFINDPDGSKALRFAQDHLGGRRSDYETRVAFRISKEAVENRKEQIASELQNLNTRQQLLNLALQGQIQNFTQTLASISAFIKALGDSADRIIANWA